MTEGERLRSSSASQLFLLLLTLNEVISLLYDNKHNSFIVHMYLLFGSHESEC